MARSIEEVYNYLVERIASRSGSSWSSLKDSMVGKELLYVAANVVSATESISDQVNGVVDLSRYTMDQLIAYAYTQDVPIDFGRPSSVKVQFTGSVGGNVICSPYQIRMQIGSLTFYNIDYCTLSSPVELYAGTPCYTVSGSVLSLPFVFSGTQGAWRLYLELKEGQYQSSYIKLGTDVFSRSVWVFAQGIGSDVVFPYTTYNAALISPDAKLYKVRGLWDYTTCVVFGDSNWAQPVLPTQYNYEVVWLQSSYARFTVTNSSSISLTALDGTVTDGLTVGNGDFTVLSTTDGEGMSLSYARNSVVSDTFKSQGLVTAAQVRNYLMSFSSVQDAYLEATAGSVSAYILPTVQTDSAFGFLQDYLYQYGVQGITYSVTVAVAQDFIVRLTAVTAEGALQLAQARSYIGTLYAYSNITLSTQVSTSLIQQALSLQGLTGLRAELVGQDAILLGGGSTVKLTSLPAVGSIVLYSGDGMTQGFDVNGKFKEYLPLSSNVFPYTNCAVSRLGDYAWVTDVGCSYLVSPEGSRVLLSDISEAISAVPGGYFAPYSTGSLLALCEATVGVVLGNTISFTLYNDLSVFHEGVYSLMTAPTYVTPVNSGAQYMLFPCDDICVYKMLGLHSSSSMVDYVVCAVGYAPTGTVPTQVGLARYRRGSSLAYYFDLTMMSAQTTSANAMASGYYDGMWYMPTSGSTTSNALAGFTLYSVVPTGSDTVGTVTDYSVYVDLFQLAGSTVSLSGVTVLSIYVVSTTVMYMLYKDSDAATTVKFGVFYFVVSDSSSGSQFRYRAMQAPVEFTEETGLPIQIISGDIDSVVLSSAATGALIFWRGAVATLSASSGVSVASGSSSCLNVTTVGGVDYAQGYVYGVTNSGSGSYLQYVVASTLQGGSTYPNLLGVETA